VTSVLAISGSLRAASSNTTILHAVSMLAPPGVEVTLYGGLALIPPFNPDVEKAGVIPLPVVELQRQLAAADAILICSPEYAHGVPGVLKNALDWVVGDGTLVGKPVAVINATPWSTHAHASLIETLTIMSWRVVDEASVGLPQNGRRLDAAAIAADPDLSGILREALAALVAAARVENSSR